MNREFDLPSNRSRRALALFAAAALLFTMALGHPPVTRGVAALASDAFGRTVVGGWGNLDSGQAWLITNGNDAATDVNGSVGQMTHTAIGELKARVPTFNTADVDISAKFRAESPADDAPASDTEFVLYSRYDAEPDFCCYLRLGLSFANGSASPVLRVDRQKGTFTGGIAQVTLPAINNDPTVAWKMKFETVGNAVRAKAWLASQSEPSSWLIDITDSQVNGVGQDNQFVIASFTNDVNPAMVIDIDDVNVTAASAPVDTTPPTVISRSPLANATGVGLGTTVSAQFSEQVSGVASNSFALSKLSGLVSVAATVSYDTATRTASLHPSAPLQAGTTYRVALSFRIEDLAGNPLAWTTWNFTTAAGTTTYNPPAPVTFKAGTHTGYQFNSAGAVTASKTFTLLANSSAAASARKPISNQSGMWLAITNGVWAGYLIRESNVTYVTATPVILPSTPNATFSPAKSLTFKKGTHTGYQFNSAGALIASKTFTLANNSSAPTVARSSTITKQSGTWFLVSAGVWAGYWVRSSDVVTLAP